MKQLQNLAETVNYAVTHNGCLMCPLKNGVLTTTSADGLCVEHRKQKHDKKACYCGAQYMGQKGWYVPSFGSYSDVSYVCPDDIIKGQKNFIYKNKRLKEIPVEREKLYDLQMKYKYRCKGYWTIEAKLEALRKEHDDCWAGSGFNPQPNVN